MKKPESMSQEELITEVKNLRSRKKYGLVWEDKPEDVVVRCQKELPVLDEDKGKNVVTDKNNLVTNLIIEGDNYHSLSVLNYTHKGKIDVIYIDPPYNRGGDDFIYNDAIVDRNDTYRHSKWLSFMASRLRLAKNLLSSDGSVFISIDDTELFNLKLLCDEIFGENNFITTVTVQVNKGGRDYLPIAVTHEYVLCYRKSEEVTLNELVKDVDFKTTDSNGGYELRELRNRNPRFNRQNRPNLFYAVYADPTSINTDKECLVSLEKSSKYSVEIFPRNSKEEDSCWRWGKKKFLENNSDVFSKTQLVARQKKDGNWNVYEKNRRTTTKSKSIWDESEVRTEAGTIELGKLGLAGKFDHPKPVYLIKKVVQLGSKPDSIILDFFAGSGTTGHAVLSLNKEDGGDRKFILCTNNESKIAENVTYERVKRVAQGYSGNKDENVEGLGGNLRYFKTSFIKKDKVTDDTRRELVKRATEMICVKEDTFNKKYDNKQFKVYESTNKVTGVLYDLDSIAEFKEKISTLGKPSFIYVFSLTNETFASDFSDLTVKYKLVPIPESILEVYRKLFG